MDVSLFLLHKSSPAFSFIQTSVLSSPSPNDSFLSASPLNHLFSHLLHLKHQHIYLYSNPVRRTFGFHERIALHRRHNVFASSRSISAPLPVSLPIRSPFCSVLPTSLYPYLLFQQTICVLGSPASNVTSPSYFACPCLFLTWPSISYQVSIPFISFSLL
jgi:hypothetical protein